MHEISPRELKRLLLGDDEFALLDVREEGTFSEAHLLFAVCVPFSRIELLIGDLVPRQDTPVVVVGEPEDGDLDRRALERLRGLGYTDVRVLAGGIAAWQAAGFELSPASTCQARRSASSSSAPATRRVSPRPRSSACWTTDATW